MDKPNTSFIVPAWELTERGIPQTHIAADLEKDRDTVMNIIQSRIGMQLLIRD